MTTLKFYDTTDNTWKPLALLGDYVKRAGDTMPGSLQIEGTLTVTDGDIVLPTAEASMGRVWTATDDLGNGEWEDPAAILSSSLSDPVLIEWFGADTEVNGWVQQAGVAGSMTWPSPPPSTPTVPGVMRLHAAVGDTVLAEWAGSPLPYGSDSLYRVRVSASAPDGWTGSITVGMIGYFSDGTTVVDSAGGTNRLLGHNAIAKVSGQSDTAVSGFTEYVGYISGRSSDANDVQVPADGTSAPWNSALAVSSGVSYWRPFIKVIAGASGADIDIDAIEVYRQSAKVEVPLGILSSALEVTGDSYLTDANISGNVVIPPTGQNLADGFPNHPVWDIDQMAWVDVPTGWTLTAASADGLIEWQEIPPPISVGNRQDAPRIGDVFFDTSMDQQPHMVKVGYTSTAGTTISAGLTTPAAVPGWDSLRLNFPCDGILMCHYMIFAKVVTAGNPVRCGIRANGTSSNYPTLMATALHGTDGLAQAVTATANGEFILHGTQGWVIGNCQDGADNYVGFEWAAGGAGSPTVRAPSALFIFYPYANDRVRYITMGTP